MPVFEHPLLAGCDPGRMRAILAVTQPRPINAGRLLHSPDQEGGSLHLVLRGLLRAFEVTPDGREVLIEIIGPGGFDGILALRGYRGHFTEALQDSLVVSLTSSQVDALSADARIARKLIELLVARVERREEQLRLFAIREPVKRLGALLLQLGEVLGHADGSRLVMEYRLTHQALANMLGIRRETVTHALQRLSLTGAVKATGGRLLVNPVVLQGHVSTEPLSPHVEAARAS